jgi:hypothetical protein
MVIDQSYHRFSNLTQVMKPSSPLYSLMYETLILIFQYDEVVRPYEEPMKELDEVFNIDKD